MSRLALSCPKVSPSATSMQMVYATACCGDVPAGVGSFVPLTVNYAERFSAVGKTRLEASQKEDVLGIERN